MLSAVCIVIVKFGLEFEGVIQRLEKNVSWGSVPRGQRV
jgi:hypothetical protein